MKLPVVNDKEILVMCKTLCYLIKDKSGTWMIHREHLEDRGWSCEDSYSKEGYMYITYKKEIVKGNMSYEV